MCQGAYVPGLLHLSTATPGQATHYSASLSLLVVTCKYRARAPLSTLICCPNMTYSISSIISIAA